MGFLSRVGINMIQNHEPFWGGIIDIHGLFFNLKYDLIKNNACLEILKIMLFQKNL